VYRSQFQNEASLAGKLRHPHIVAILDAVVQQDSGYIAMEYVKGGDLSRHVAAGKLLPVADVLQIAFKCCGALEYAAREGIVHSDIKPSNLMLAEGTEVKIADFGAAYLRKSQVIQTAAMVRPITCRPSRSRARSSTSTATCTRWRVAVRAPHRKEAVHCGYHRGVGAENPEPGSDPAEQRAAGAAEVRGPVVLRSMAKKPERRYPSWAEFALELSKVVQQTLPPASFRTARNTSR